METITLKDIEMLAKLVARAGVNDYEAAWANQMLNALREAVKPKKKPPEG